MYVERAGNPNDDLQLPEATKAHLAKFSENLGKMPLQVSFYSAYLYPISPLTHTFIIDN